FGGQRFIPATVNKLRRARHLLMSSGSRAVLEVDGGINHETIAACVQAGADTFVAGNAIFSADDPPAELRRLRELAEAAATTSVDSFATGSGRTTIAHGATE